MNLKAMDPLAIRLEIIRMVEHLQGRSDAAYDAFQPAFDALDRTVTVDVFDPKEPRMPIMKFEATYGEYRA